MRVHHDALGLAVGDTEDNIGGFTPDAVELDEFLERVGNLAGVLCGDGAAAIPDRPSFVAKETGRTNHRFQFSRRRGGKVGSDAVLLEQRGRDLVNAFIRALRAQNGGDKKLEGIAVMERATRIRIGGAQSTENGMAAAR